jgi:mercuric ion binding protein
MRRLLPLLVLALLPLAALAGAPQTVVLDVQNMTCPVCPITVKKALQKVPGVADAKVDLDSKTAIVKFDPDKASTAALVKATTDAGYPSTVHK